jgi:hypothetical protein
LAWTGFSPTIQTGFFVNDLIAVALVTDEVLVEPVALRIREAFF